MRGRVGLDSDSMRGAICDMKTVVADPLSLSTKRIATDSLMAILKQIVIRKGDSSWRWGIAACLLLAISGGVRHWRDYQFRSLADLGAVSPFPLSELPEHLGEWRAIEGTDTQLDPEIARVAGSSDHVLRSYMNVRSGQTVSVLVLYGLAGTVFAHTPQACYPAAGYQSVMDPVDYPFSIEGTELKGLYRRGFYSRTVGGLTQYVEVVHTFLHRGEWIANLAPRWKMFRYHPGSFKIQLQLLTSELSTETSSSESLLKEISRYIDFRVSRARSM